MKRFFFYSLLLLVVSSCCNSGGKGKIMLSVAGVADSSEVVFSRLAFNQVLPLDTLYSLDGKVEYEMANMEEGSPQFIYVACGGKNIVSLVLLPGDKITVKSGAGPLSIEGSEESLRLQSAEKDIADSQSKFDSLSVLLKGARDNGDKVEEERIGKELSSLYVARKRASIKYVFANAKSITSIPVLFQRLSPELPVFAEYSDALIFKKVYDSLSVVYPTSPFVASLADEASSRMNTMSLAGKVSGAEVVDFPEISLPDINSRTKNLSDYKGKVIVLLFWTVTMENQSVFNAELKSLYDRYSYNGMEIYQVSLDIDKTLWATQVREQQIPWVSVCDINGTSSRYAMMYNVTKIPSMFVISKDGQIVGKDVFDFGELDKLLVKELRK